MLLGVWLILVITITIILKEFPEVAILVVPTLILTLTLWLVALLKKRWGEEEATGGPLKLDGRKIFRFRFTIQGMLVGVAFVAFPLWPIHIWLMHPVYFAMAVHESFVAELCMEESRLMADRAKQCRLRAVEGTAWDLDDDIAQGLKICPYGRIGHSWSGQTEIWDRAAERSRLAAQKHRKKTIIIIINKNL